ncbi:MAG: hypothetical protein ACYSU3_00030 [Planctomycetota bacterium]
MKEIMTKPWKLGSTELAWKEPHFYHVRLRRDVLWRLLISVGIGLVVAGIMLAASSFRDVPGDWNFALALGPLAFFFALFGFFGRYGQIGGHIVLRRDTIRRITISMKLPNFIVRTEERWEYDQISKCVFIPANVVW